MNNHKNKNLTHLLLSIFIVCISISFFQVIYKNYIVEEFLVTAFQFGTIDAMKEIPGLIAIFFILIAIRFKERNVLIFSILLIALGLLLYSLASGFWGLMVYTFIFSTGTHLFFIYRDYLITDLTTEDNRSTIFGYVASLGAGAGLLGMLFVWILSQRFETNVILFIGLPIALVSTIFVKKLNMNKGKSKQNNNLYLKKAYFPYYLLTTLSAAREMIFITFATLLLIVKFETPLSTMVLLYSLHGVIAVLTRPYIGKVIKKIGISKALAVNYIIVTFIFIGYAYIEHIWFIYILFVLDDVFVGFDDIGISTYVGKLVPREELSTTLAVGSTLSHVIAVTIPIVGSLIWFILGSTLPFLLGCIVTVFAAFVSSRINNLNKVY
ncbi:MFS transporter [Chengkuizengella sediminis]|uniref:MFS transporter n=1 Tax=Chengkuizengella sediminis TaxID=1885917 RepID=UPI0013896BE4|nr:MFS transporter [Chengkuizengella sediminis]NDI34939.1 MFS transporter [Chengkuizengella sediminis]